MHVLRRSLEPVIAIKLATSKSRAIAYRVALTSLLIFLANSVARASVQPQTAAERTILRQITSGQIDLSHMKSNVIRASFLWDVLTSDKTKVENNKIWIIGADIEEDRYTNYEIGEKRSNLTVSNELSFQSTTFQGTFSCVHCHFKGGLKFVGTDFNEGIDLSYSQIDGNLTISGNIAWRPDSVSPINVDGIHVNGDFYLAPSKIDDDSEITLEGVTAHILQLVVRSPASFSRLDLTSSNTEGISIDAAGSKVEVMNLQDASVKEGLFADIDIHEVNFDSASFGFLTLQLREFPKTIHLDDATFRNLYIAKEPPLVGSSGHKMVHAARPVDVTKSFLEAADFSMSAFNAYESQLRSRGLIREANQVFFSMHEHRRALDWTWSKWPLATLDYAQEYVLGYGRSPTPPLVWSIIFMIGGFFIFGVREAMEPKVASPVAFSPLWYSLELFLPVVDLGMAKEWRPKSSPGWRVTYAHFQQIAGWVLVPVALAAVTGVFK